MRVIGLESVWAAGDVTWFPVKQGGLAAQQADVAARSIAAAAGAHVPIEPFHPVLRAALITGDAPEFLRSPLPSRAEADDDAGRRLWSPAAKIAGRYLGPYLDRASRGGLTGGARRPPADRRPRRRRRASTGSAVALLLAAADADARVGDFDGALSWLSLVEELNLVIPATYVAQRDRWRRRLSPDAPPQAAAGPDRSQRRQRLGGDQRPAAANRMASRARGPRRGRDERPPVESSTGGWNS